MGYSRFSGRLLPEDRVLAGFTALVDDGGLAGSSDIASLRRMFGDLMTFNDWLSGPGQRVLSQAVGGVAQSLSLRRQRHTCQSSIGASLNLAALDYLISKPLMSWIMVEARMPSRIEAEISSFERKVNCIDGSVKPFNKPGR